MQESGRRAQRKRRARPPRGRTRAPRRPHPQVRPV